MHTYTALYDTRAQAEAAQAELRAIGIVDLDDSLYGDADQDRFRTRSDRYTAGEDRPFYEESLRRGGFLLRVNVDDQQSARALEVLERSHAVDVDDRERTYRESGWTGTTGPVATGSPATGSTLDRDADGRNDVVEGAKDAFAKVKRALDKGTRKVRAYAADVADGDDERRTDRASETTYVRPLIDTTSDGTMSPSDTGYDPTRPTTTQRPADFR